MPTGTPKQIENQLRDLPTLICEMQVCGSSMTQIYQVLNCRCQAAANVISRLNHNQNQKIEREYGGGK